MIGILSALLTGLIVGALARLFMPGRDPAGFVVTMLLGVAGAVLAYVAGSALGLYQRADSAPGWIASVIGAMAVLAVYRFSRRPRTV